MNLIRFCNLTFTNESLLNPLTFLLKPETNNDRSVENPNDPVSSCERWSNSGSYELIICLHSVSKLRSLTIEACAEKSLIWFLRKTRMWMLLPWVSRPRWYARRQQYMKRCNLLISQAMLGFYFLIKYKLLFKLPINDKIIP